MGIGLHNGKFNRVAEKATSKEPGIETQKRFHGKFAKDAKKSIATNKHQNTRTKDKWQDKPSSGLRLVSRLAFLFKGKEL